MTDAFAAVLGLGLLLGLGWGVGCGPSHAAPTPAADAPSASPRTAPKPAPAAQLPSARDPTLDDQVDEIPPAQGASCGTALQCFEQARAAERNQPARAAELFGEACELELAAACRRLGALYGKGRGVERDDRRARQLIERACSLGSTAACDDLGH